MTQATRSEAGPASGRYAARTNWPWTAAIAATVVLFLASAFAGTAGQWIYGALAGEPAQPATQLLPSLVAMQLTLTVLVIGAARLFGGRPTEVLALGPVETGWRPYVRSLLELLAIVAVFDTLAFLIKPEPLMGDIKPFVAMVRSDLWWLAVIAVGVGAPLSEELLFRGFLQSALARTRIGFAGASVVTTAAWTALHANYSVLGVAQVAVIGLYLCWVLWRTGSLRVTIFCHAAYNTLMIMLLALAPMPA